MSKKNKDIYLKPRKEYAEKILKEKNILIETSFDNYKLREIKEEDKEFTSFLWNGKYNIPGSGSTKLDAVIDSLIHLECMGLRIKEYMNIVLKEENKEMEETEEVEIKQKKKPKKKKVVNQKLKGILS